MKRILILMLTVVLALSVVSCGKSKEESTKEKLKENSTAQESQAEKNVDNSEKNKDVKAEKIEIGGTMSDGRVEVKLNKVKFTDKILPKDQPSGFSYYEADKDHTYIAIDADVKNLQEDNLQGDKVMTVIADDAKNQQKGYAVLQDQDRGFSYAGTTSIAPAATRGAVFIVECPKKMEKEKSIKLTFDLEGKKYEYTMKK